MTAPRGEHLLEAVFEVLATQGADALSMRTVAKAAGVSLAQVQYYFRTKADLVEAAFTYSGEQFLAAVGSTNTESVTELRAIIEAWLPLDEEREKRARTWLAFSAIAATDPRLAGIAARLDADLRAWFTEQLDGRTGPVSVDALAAQLFAVVDGLTVQLLVLPRADRERVAAPVLDAWFAQLSR